MSVDGLGELFGLHGRLAVVTGARRGIGQAVCRALALAGADVVGVSRHLEDDGETAAAVRAAGAGFEAIRCDLADREAVAALARDLVARPVDILVNNGGTIRRAPVVEHTDEDWDHVLDVNLRAAFVLSRALGNTMLDRGHGRIVNVASMLSFQGGIQVPSYTASKSAVLGLTRALANEWAGRGVNVNAVAPGYVATENTAPLRADPEREPAIRARIPAGRWGQPEDVAGAVLFLASRAADYVHGAVLAVDGGWLAR